MGEMEPKKNFLRTLKNKAVLAAGAMGLIVAANAGEISANSKTVESNSGKNEGDSTIVTSDLWAQHIPRDIEQSTGEDPLGTDIALALTVNGAEIPVTRVPASPEILSQLAKVMDLTPDSLVNTLSWDSPDVNMGDVVLLEVSVGGTPEYVVLNFKAIDASQKSKTFHTAAEAKFSIFKAQINIVEGANLRTGPGVNFPATKFVTGTKEYFTGETLTDGDLTWYKLVSGKWVAQKGLSGERLQLIIETNAAVAETGSSTKELKIPGFEGIVLSSVWKAATPLLQELIDNKFVPTSMLSLEEVKKIGPTGFSIDAETGEPTMLTVALADCTQHEVMYGTEKYSFCLVQWVGGNDTVFAALIPIASQGRMDLAIGDKAPLSLDMSEILKQLRDLPNGAKLQIKLVANNIGYSPDVRAAYIAIAQDLAKNTAAGTFPANNYDVDVRFGTLQGQMQPGIYYPASFIVFPQ